MPAKAAAKEPTVVFMISPNQILKNRRFNKPLNWPPKISCFSWTALHGAFLTQDNLARRKFQMATRCYMCMKEAKTHNHVFLQCQIAADLWSMFLALFGLKWVMPQNIRDVLISWSCWKVDSTIKRIWKMIPAGIFGVSGTKGIEDALMEYQLPTNL
ncbi:hypothetical protein AABB24_006171 [Solanum stoloniferum]|uniref:Reverse transcriptase zinc-binding domain-containing protein n=1 Tax=Solanum stoloniferum TaxID=62892 RepID=A0ABD2V4A5_9SOLN